MIDTRVNTVRQNNGILMTFFTRNRNWVRAYGGGRCSWELANERYVNKLLGDRPVRTVLDIGANIGQETVLFARIAERVIAFEPMEEVFKVLSQNVEQNNYSNVELHNLGCSDQPANGQNMRWQESNEGASYICDKPGRNNVKVNLVPLDSFLPDLSDVDFVKIDVEGHEISALKGMIGMLKRNKPILQIEAVDSLLSRFGNDSRDIYDLLVSLGYNVITTNDSIRITTREGCLRENRKRADLFFRCSSSEPLLE